LCATVLGSGIQRSTLEMDICFLKEKEAKFMILALRYGDRDVGKLDLKQFHPAFTEIWYSGAEKHVFDMESNAEEIFLDFFSQRQQPQLPIQPPPFSGKYAEFRRPDIHNNLPPLQSNIPLSQPTQPYGRQNENLLKPGCLSNKSSKNITYLVCEKTEHGIALQNYLNQQFAKKDISFVYKQLKGEVPGDAKLVILCPIAISRLDINIMAISEDKSLKEKGAELLVLVSRYGDAPELVKDQSIHPNLIEIWYLNRPEYTFTGGAKALAVISTYLDRNFTEPITLISLKRSLGTALEKFINKTSTDLMDFFLDIITYPHSHCFK